MRFKSVHLSRLMIRRSVYEVPWQRLYDNGFRWIAFDIENTLEPITKLKLLRPSTVTFLVGLIDIGFWGISLCTNSLGDFSSMVDQLVSSGIPAAKIQLVQPDRPHRIWLRKNPRKPKAAYFDRVWSTGINCDHRWVIFVGDKLNFDILPATKVGFYVIWINRLGKDLPLEFVRRGREALTRRRHRLPHPRNS